MKLRLDLLQHLTPGDVLEEVQANTHRFKPEPHFSKTGRGSISSSSTAERANAAERHTALIRKLKQRARRSGKPSAKRR